MPKETNIYQLHDIEYKVIYSGRRTIGINILPDSSVILRVPYRTSNKIIERIVQEKAGWITKHRDSYRLKQTQKSNSSFSNGDMYPFRGNDAVLNIIKSGKSYCRFNNNSIELGLEKTEDKEAIKRLLYKGYKNEAIIHIPEIFRSMLKKHENELFKPSGLVIRTMKRRWGSCSYKGIITLSTELIKLPDVLIEYVITHELCHLKHHNHGAGYYKLLSELCPEWREMRKIMRRYMH